MSKSYSLSSRGIQIAIASGLAGWAIARLAAADRLWPLDRPATPLLSFTPQVAASAWLSAMLLRDSRASAVAATAACAMTAVVAPRAVPRRQPDATGPQLRVLTANLLVGRVSAASVVDLVGGTSADLLFVQELTDEAKARLSRAGLADLLPHTLNDLGKPDSRGNAIYSRYPLSDCPAAARRPAARPAAMLHLPSGPVRLVCVHLPAPRPPWRGWVAPGVWLWRDELSALPSPPAAGGGGSPVILAGDFNSTLDHAEFRRLLSRGYVDAASQSGKGLVPTWGPAPGRRALLTIDHVLADARCAVTAASVHPLPGTDHRAVFAVLRLPG